MIYEFSTYQEHFVPNSYAITSHLSIKYNKLAPHGEREPPSFPYNNQQKCFIYCIYFIYCFSLAYLRSKLQIRNLAVAKRSRVSCAHNT